MTNAPLSPSIHEATISRHMNDDADPVLGGLHDAVQSARAACEKAAKMTSAVLANRLKTEPERHREAREAGFATLARATNALDEAGKAAAAEISRLEGLTSAPPSPKDAVLEARARKLRERLAALPEARRKAVLDHAAASGDDLLIGAVLSVPEWVVGLSEPERNLVRRNWASRKYPAELDRIERLPSRTAEGPGAWRSRSSIS